MASNLFFRRVRAVVVLGLVGGTIAMAMGAAPASAGLGLSCPSSTSTPFVPWSDGANYVFAETDANRANVTLGRAAPEQVGHGRVDVEELTAAVGPAGEDGHPDRHTVKGSTETPLDHLSGVRADRHPPFAS